MKWNDAFKIAEKYYTEHGNLFVPKGYISDGLHLYTWIAAQRHRYTLNRSQSDLAEDTLKLKDEIPPERELQEEKKEIREGKEEREGEEGTEGKEDGEGEEDREGKEGIEAGGNRENQRNPQQQQKKKERKENPLTSEQISALESIGMVWNVGDYTWERSFAVAEKYYKEHGNLVVPKHYEEDGVNLSHWIWAQRRIVNGTRGERSRRLTEEQIRRLEEIGMEWAPKTKGFSYYYGLAKKFYEEYGHTDFPDGEVVVGGEILPESGETLAAWKKEQENKDFLEQMDGRAKEKRSLLHEIGICTEYGMSQWEKKYRAAEAYYRQHGDLLVPYSYVTEDGIRLGKWISNQRIKRRGTWGAPLTEEQIRKLDAIGMSWDESGNRGRRKARQ